MYLYLTIAEANQLAARHEDDPNWDFWKEISERTYEQALQTCSEDQLKHIENSEVCHD